MEKTIKKTRRSRKEYRKPTFTLLGRVNRLTAGGSGQHSEFKEHNGTCRHGRPFMSDPRC